MQHRLPDKPPAHETGPYLEPLRRAIRGALARLPWWLSEFILFGLKQAWACLFAGIMLGLILGTKFVWQADWPLYRYDFLFLMALAIQAFSCASAWKAGTRPRSSSSITLPAR